MNLKRSSVGPQRSEPEVRADLEGWFGTASPNLVRLYSELDGIEWKWQVIEPAIDPKPILGMAYIPPVSVLRESFRAQGDGSQVNLDQFVAEGLVAARFTAGDSSERMLFHPEGEGYYDLGINLEEYLECLLESRGFFYWMQSLCPECQGNREVSRFRELAPKLFPDIDMSLFEVRSR